MHTPVSTANNVHLALLIFISCLVLSPVQHSLCCLGLCCYGYSTNHAHAQMGSPCARDLLFIQLHVGSTTTPTNYPGRLRAADHSQSSSNINLMQVSDLGSTSVIWPARLTVKLKTGEGDKGLWHWIIYVWLLKAYS